MPKKRNFTPSKSLMSSPFKSASFLRPKSAPDASSESATSNQPKTPGKHLRFLMLYEFDGYMYRSFNYKKIQKKNIHE